MEKKSKKCKKQRNKSPTEHRGVWSELKSLHNVFGRMFMVSSVLKSLIAFN